tara:strand:+ start:312 stop:494 length:183 start_codon:yes stop_codon:yes gene_type:complete
MIPFEDPNLAEEALEKDIERIITRENGEKVLHVCTNPKCFEDTCRGECQESPLKQFDTIL